MYHCTLKKIMRVTDVLCLSAVTIHGLVLEWLDAEGVDVRPSNTWVEQLLRGMRLSIQKPAKCVKELLSPALQEEHAPAQHQSVLADGQARCQRRPRREHRRDVLPALAGVSDRVGPARREAVPAAGQRKGGHDIHGRLQHGSWPAGHAGADRTRGQDRRRLAGAALAGAHTPRRVRERLGHHDHDPAARGHIGRRAEPEQRGTSVDPSVGHGQHPRQRGHPGRHAGDVPSRRAVLPPATKHVVLAALRRGRPRRLV